MIYRDAGTGRFYTYARVKQVAEQLGAGLKSQWQWNKGDVLTTFLPNCIDTPSAIWGCLWAGGVVAPANPAYTVEELARQLKASNSKGLATHAELLPTASKAAEIAGLPPRRIMLLGEQCDQVGTSTHFTDLLEYGHGLERTTIQPQQDLAFLVYSSGTTGHPKAVMLSHSNIVSDLVMVSSVEAQMLSSSRDRILSILPYYHVYGTHKSCPQPVIT